MKIGFGSDLLGQMQDDQCREFLIRSEVMKPHEIIRSATIVNAEILPALRSARRDRAWRVRRSAGRRWRSHQDLGLFQDQGAHLPAIIKGGRFYENQLQH